MPYVNPIPAIDVGKSFEFRLAMKFDQLLPVEQARRQCAEYILAQTPETLESWLSCSHIKALYPGDLTPEERARLLDGNTPGKNPDRG